MADFGVNFPYWAIFCYFWFIEPDSKKIDRFNNWKPRARVP